MESLTLLLNQSIDHISSTAASFSHLVQSCISLTLLIVSKHLGAEDLSMKPLALDLLTTLQGFICNWMKCQSVIGGSFFGQTVGSNWKGKEELKVLLLSIFQVPLFVPSFRFGLQYFKRHSLQTMSSFLQDGSNWYTTLLMNE